MLVSKMLLTFRLYPSTGHDKLFLMTLGMNRIISFFLVIALMGWANHCILHDAFASEKETTSKSSPCHSENKKQESHHNKCRDTGCCQPALSKGKLLLDIGFHTTFPVIFVSFFKNLTIDIDDFKPNSKVFHETGPPKFEAWLIKSLTLTPQAPPLEA